MSQFIGTSMPRGSAGDITRGMFDYTTEVKQNDTTTPVADDGVLVSLTATGKATPATDASKVYGIAVRDYRQVGPDGKVWPKDAFVCVLRRGYVAVRAAGTPAPGGAVYLDATNKGVTATKADGATAIPNCVFMGTKDDAGLAEIAFNI